MLGKWLRRHSSTSANGRALGRSEQLERDLQDLKHALERSGVGFLLDAMESSGFYSPLISKEPRTWRDPAPEEPEEISWYACRRAEQLSSEADKAALLQELEGEPRVGRRKHICFALAHLCSNTRDVKLYALLMEILAAEPDEEVRISAYIGLERLDKRGLDVHYLLDVAVNGSSNESPNAIYALENSDPARTEDALIEIIRFGGGRALDAGCRVLGMVGTRKCLSDLEMVKRRSRDLGLRSDIDQSIAEILARYP